MGLVQLTNACTLSSDSRYVEALKRFDTHSPRSQAAKKADKKRLRYQLNRNETRKASGRGIIIIMDVEQDLMTQSAKWT